MNTQASTEVLICGAGAAGLTLAIDLARRGVPQRLIDKLPAPFAGSRGKGIQPRTQEVFEDLGVIDRMVAAGGLYPPQRLHRADGTHADSQEIVLAPPTVQEPYRMPLMVPQFRTEAVLRERLAELGGAVAYGRELTGFVQDADGVTATVAGPDGVETIRCRYLVGGDGGRSFVRRALEIDFPGQTLGVRAIVADLELDGLSRDAWHRFGEGDMNRQISFCPLPRTDLFQLQAPIPLDGDVDLSVAGLQAFIDARWLAGGLTLRGVAWASAYSMNARLADRYRAGRVLLMGDAAHIHPPTGGQGLNTSLQDAYNLGWKLAAVLAGAPDALLDTYEEERRPTAAGMLGLATGLLDKAKTGDMKRGREVHQLDLGYRFSSLALAASADRPETALKPGDRAPDGVLRGAAGRPTRVFDLLAGPHWTLLARTTGPTRLPAPRPGLRIHTVGEDGAFQDPDDALAATYGLAEGDLVLIRPDGYVAAILPVADGARLEAYLAEMGLASAQTPQARAA
ncbi:FAD-dependent oxidoreductase [Caulobacter sp. BK020]|uniref:FAD-dependent oxidoreductase n=1 Tax=Caulobacter sp. BK020 TaxID=2512117 RepID=UPI0010536FCC|nr:FAD-dependent oxidoreductase [Caulobacter sp. BK020]TCS10215.1 2-polyprenyl-6-methoxyphenol hydroxylase-like FAD-dependent oxidoreductase [Caulobacter sp. BK020]